MQNSNTSVKTRLPKKATATSRRKASKLVASLEGTRLRAALEREEAYRIATEEVSFDLNLQVEKLSQSVEDKTKELMLAQVEVAVLTSTLCDAQGAIMQVGASLAHER